MQFKTLLVAFGLSAAVTAAALPEPQLETRTPAPVLATFKIRRFTPLTGFNPDTPSTWSNNQYTNVASANAFFNYNGVTAETAYRWTFVAGTLRGSSDGIGGLVPRNLQSFGITVTPVTFGGVGEEVKVTIGPGPLFEVKFQTVRSGNPVPGWTAFDQIGGNIFLGKATDVPSPLRFRAEGYVPAPVPV